MPSRLLSSVALIAITSCSDLNQDQLNLRQTDPSTQAAGSAEVIAMEHDAGQQELNADLSLQSASGLCDAKARSTRHEFIQSVMINAVSVASGDNGGYYFHSESIITGADLTIELTPTVKSRNARQFVRVWIDLNRNNRFETNELMGSVSGVGKQSLSFRLPESALTKPQLDKPGVGDLKMRISMRNGGFSAACGSFNAGEVEDYTLYFAAPKHNAKFPQDVDQDGCLSFEDLDRTSHAAAGLHMPGQTDVSNNGMTNSADGSYLLQPLNNPKLSCFKIDGWHNEEYPEDVNRNGDATKEDADLIIAFINEKGAGKLPEIRPSEDQRWLDVNQDGLVTPLDAMKVLEHIDAQPRRVMGDVFHDELVEEFDAVRIHQYIARIKGRMLTLPNRRLADVNADRIVDMDDVKLVLEFSVGKVEEFPVLDGDLNFDGIFSSDDLRILEAHLSGARKLEQHEGAVADLDNNGSIDQTDFQLVFAKVYGMQLSIDFNGDGKLTSEHDGLMVIRFLAGFTGDALSSGVLTPERLRGVESTLQSMLAAGLLDVDGDGESLALADGIAISRYLLGQSGAKLMEVLNSKGRFNTPAAVEARIRLFLPRS